MGDVKPQCPNCESYNTKKKPSGTFSIGAIISFIGFIFGGGGEGAASFYGGEMGTYWWGFALLILGIIIMLGKGIYNLFNEAEKIYDCEVCNCEFNVIE